MPRPAISFLALAVTLGDEAPPNHFLDFGPHPASGVPSLLAVAAAAVLVAWFWGRTEHPRRDEGPIAAALTAAATALHSARAALVWLAGALALYAASLGLLELAVRLGGESSGRVGFQWGHVAVSALFALVALALVETGGRLSRADLSVGGLVLTGLALLKTVTYDDSVLSPTRWAIASLIVAAGALLSGFEYQRLSAGRRDGLRREAAAAILASAILGGAAVVELADGTWHGVDVQGGGLLVLALPYALLSAAVFRSAGLRDLATLLWAIPLTVAGAALFLLLEGAWLVLALALAAALLSLLAVAVRESRFQLASALYLLSALVYTLAHEAPPRDLVVAAEHPGTGAVSLVLVALAAVAFGLCARHERAAWQPHFRLAAFAGAGVLALYALSLGILELSELVSGAGVVVDFQRGHTAVSAAWAVIGLCLLTLGLVRGSRGIRLAGFGLYGISIAKLFLYDLTYSSPMGRPLSFLAVGILLLASGFFYQRLSERMAT